MLKGRTENTELNLTLWALVLSLLIHVIFGGTIEMFGTKMQSLRQQPALSTVDLVDEQPKKMTAEERKQQQIVRNAKLPDEMIDKNKKAKRRFLSEDDQTVLEETRAADSGMTENRSEAGAAKTFQNQRHQALMKKLTPNPLKEAAKEQAKADDKRAQIKTFDTGDVDVAGMTKANQRNIAQDDKPLPMPNMGGFAFDKGLSTTGDQLPSDIKVGRFTALNTDRYLYYAFYARAEELFRHHWEHYAEAAMYTYQQNHRVAPEEMYTCRLEILLDRNGTFVKGILRESSGIPGLDTAPSRAFHDAQRIPNPPPEMVQKDGYIHMDYMFTVVNSPAYASGS